MPIALIRTIYLNKINSKLVIYVTKIKKHGSNIIIFFLLFYSYNKKNRLAYDKILKIAIENSAYELEMLMHI
jgi:hypothetical protein